MIQSIKGIVFTLVFLVSSMNAEVVPIGTVEITEAITEVTGPTKANPSIRGESIMWCKNPPQVGFTEKYSVEFAFNDVTKQIIVGEDVYTANEIAGLSLVDGKAPLLIARVNHTLIKPPIFYPSNNGINAYTKIFSETGKLDYRSLWIGSEYRGTLTRTNTFTESDPTHTISCTVTYSINGITSNKGVSTLEVGSVSIINQMRGALRKALINPDKSKNVREDYVSMGSMGVRG
ncbi:hypothetical protein ACFLRS_00760 [Campylobacterota bacterium]